MLRARARLLAMTGGREVTPWNAFLRMRCKGNGERCGGWEERHAIPVRLICAFDEEKYHAGLCDVCQVFGATGWKRRFRLVIQDSTSHDLSIEDKIQANNRSYFDAYGNRRTPT